MLCCSIMISVTFVGVAEIFSLLKVKLNLKICTRRKSLLILFLEVDSSNKNYEKKLIKYMQSNLFLHVSTLELAILPKNELLHR